MTLFIDLAEGLEEIAAGKYFSGIGSQASTLELLAGGWRALFLKGMRKNGIILFGFMRNSLTCMDQITAIRHWSKTQIVTIDLSVTVWR